MKIRLPSNRYEEIKERVVDVYEDFGISSIPVYPGDILQKLGYNVVSYEIFNDKLKGIANKYSSDAFRFSSGTNRSKFILYSPYNSRVRIRFSLAHELGHIILEHDLKEDSMQETEANFFANYFLVPLPLIPYKCDYDSPESVSGVFDVSLICAANSVTNCRHRKECDAKIEEYEVRLLNLYGLEVDYFKNGLRSHN